MKRKFFRRALAVVLCLTLLDVSNLTVLATNENSTGTTATVSGADAGSTVANSMAATVSGSDAGSVAANSMVATVSGGNAIEPNQLMAISEIPVPLAAASPANEEIELTINHYLGNRWQKTMLFAPSSMKAENGQIINVEKAEEYYDISEVRVNGQRVEMKDGGFELALSGEATEAAVDVYYRQTQGIYANETGMIDYDGGWDTYVDGSSSISSKANYAVGSSRENRISTIGAKGSYVTLMEVRGEDGKVYHFNINSYERYNYQQQPDGTWAEERDKRGNKIDYRAQFPILQGLLKGLSKSEGSSVYDVVEFNYDDPGFFNSDEKAGKRILDGYSLEFARSGMNYELTKVLKDDTVVCTNMGWFFPLEGTKNEFFGMRYDFSFTIGDYVGDMTYSFTGDDDLWVCLDGEVILDLGGIHDAYPKKGWSGESNEVSYAPGSVDVWAVLLGKTDYTLQDKIDYVSSSSNANKTHTVTVLFMERGGTASNCNMSFVMPNIAAEEAVVSTVTKAALKLNKVDAADGSALEGVSFTLTGGTEGARSLTTDADGTVSFSGLTEGTYTLTEEVPEGYMAAGPWTITVTSQSNTEGKQTTTVHSVTSVKDNATEAILSAVDGVYTIENVPEKPEIELEQSKTAEPVDWDARIYRLTLTASSLTENPRKKADAASKLSVTAGVVDYVDARFVVTDAEGNELAEGTKISDNAGVKGSLKKDADENWYVEWTEVTIEPEGKDNSAGWSAELYVRARENFIGGNRIPTNGPNSGIRVEEELYPFEKPTVNVKLLSLQLTDKEVTLFLGEEVTPGVYLTELNETLQVISIEDEAVALQDAPELSGEELEELLEEETLSVAYGDAEDEIGTFTYTLAEDANWENHTAERTGSAVGKYTLTVTYTAYTEAERAEIIGTSYKAPAMEQKAESVRDDGVYTVNVVAGKLVITKKLDTANIDFTQGDPIFTFKVMKDGRFYSYHTVRFTKEMLDAGKTEVTAAVLEELTKGIYTVEEVGTLRYELKDVTADGTVSASTKNGAAVFQMEMVISEDGVIKPAEAQATFTNVKKNDDNFSDTDVVVNSFVIGEDGTISWTADALKNQ